MAVILGALGCDGTAGGQGTQPDGGPSGFDATAADVRSGSEPIIDYVQALVATPNEVDFGCVEPGKPFAFNVSIENRSDGRVGPLSVNLPPDAALTILTDGCGGEYLDGWQSCRVTLFFMAAGTTQLESTLTVTAPQDHYPTWVSIVAQSSPLASKLPDPLPVVDFGEVRTRTSRSLDILATNIGDVPAMVAYAGLPTGDFQILGDECAGMTVPPQGTCRVTVTFTPTDAGPSQDLLEFGAGAACYPLSRIRVIGTGI
jgi:hypothetical protein